MNYPRIDPVIFSIGVDIHWYGLMYVVGFAAGWWLARRRAARPDSTWKPVDVDDLIFFAAVGVVLGGRIGWLLFYGLGGVIADPLSAIKIWEGGMSFHGGLLGVLFAIWLFARRRGRNLADVCDFTAPLPALGLFTGRIGNFINGELWGKPTDAAWGFVVNAAQLHPTQARNVQELCARFNVDPCVMKLHASQLYEAVLEGLVTFAIVWWFSAKPRPRPAVTGLFLLCYGVFRSLVEFVRVPDQNRLYLLWGWLTEGQLLSMPMILIGVGLLIWAYRKHAPSVHVA
jgi:phosphatidylglycerol---prolipoprotein diacylglyceryl transferase